MMTLSLTQPWAQLVAIGAKRLETRSWATRYCGWLAIHSTKSLPDYATRFFLYDQYCRDALEPAGCRTFADLPRGSVVAIARLVDCVRITRDNVPSYPEREFGDYTPGRFMWRLADVHPLQEPIPARGYQQIWEWDPPAGLLERLGVAVEVGHV